MKTTIALLCCFIIAQTIIFSLNMARLETNYNIQNQIIKDLDNSIDEKEEIITKKLVSSLKEISFISDITKDNIDLKSRLDTLEYQMYEILLRNFIPKAPAYKPDQKVQNEEVVNDNNYEPKQRESELDVASSESPPSLK